MRPTIPNPDYVADDQIYLYEDNAFVGFDLWQVKSGSIFDNIIITDDLSEAEEFGKVSTALLVVEARLVYQLVCARCADSAFVLPIAVMVFDPRLWWILAELATREMVHSCLSLLYRTVTGDLRLAGRWRQEDEGG